MMTGPPSNAPPPVPTPFLPWSVTVSVALCLQLGCAATVSGSPLPSGLPKYAPEDAALLDDTIAAEVFPTTVLVMPGGEGKLLERVVRAESVVPAVITTVSRQGTGERTVLSLSLAPTGPALSGTPWQAPITLTLPPSSPSYPQVVAADSTLVGTPLILLLRRYAADSVETLHWRAEPDTPAVRAVILRATGVRAGRASNEQP